MKFEINWHNNNLENQKGYIERLKKEVFDKENKIKQLEKNAAFYELQIKTAEGKGKTHFDRDRFMKKSI
jgi:thioredoxin-related protein